MPTYKLKYFDARGLAEVARMMFAVKGVEYEDYRFTREEWNKTLKPDRKQFPIGQCPVLVVDGDVIPQSGAINRYLAREFGFFGQTSRETAQIDVICETVDDAYRSSYSLYYEKEDEKKTEKRNDVRDRTSKPFFTFLQDYIRKAGGKYFVGNSLTLADLMVFWVLDVFTNTVKQGIPGLLELYPDLVKFYKGITEDSPLTSYLEKRQPLITDY